MYNPGLETAAGYSHSLYTPTPVAAMEDGKIEAESAKISPPFSGNCTLCKKEHIFPGIYSLKLGYTLMKKMDQGEFQNDSLPLNLLFGEMRGKMFGVMKCLTIDNSEVTLKAFSGQFNGRWHIAGWVPPLFDITRWNRVNAPAEQDIKEIGRSIETCVDPMRKELFRRRRILSQKLMKELHALYRFTNFSGSTLSFSDIFPDDRGIPTGTGDCCLPKLLNFAASHALIPLSFCEFYWGRENKSGTRKHGEFYLPCREKCAPLVGTMLCGLEKLDAHKRL